MRFTGLSFDFLELDAVPHEVGSIVSRLVFVTDGVPGATISVDAVEEHVDVVVETSPAPPPPPASSEGSDPYEVIEFSLRGPAFLRDPDDYAHAIQIVPPAADYRVRLTATLLESGNGRYVFTCWPEPLSAPRIVATADAETITSHLELPEADAGLAGAARIGRDVDGAPGARDLTDQTGTVRAERLFPRPPHTHRAPFRGAHAFTRSREGVVWKHREPAVGHSVFPVDPNHPDRLCGATGMLVVHATHDRDAEIFGTPPPTTPLIAHVDWHVPRTLSRASDDLSDTRPLLSTSTVRTVTFTPHHDGGSTLISIAHDRVPTAWVTDLTAWWELQLAIHAFEGSIG